ncbi:putative pentatricopeptide repeat-containing protein [Tanacetum coccineum]
MSGSWILDLESTGGLYREFLKRLTKDGACRFRRRELIRSYRGRLKFPELFEHHIGNRERFNVTCGLEITEKPVVKCKDVALWFRSLTGRSDVVVYPTDYKFYCPRHKGKRYRMSNGSDYFQSVKNYPISGSQLTKNFELESAGYVIDVDIHILVRLQNSTGSVVPRGWKYEYDLKLAEIVMKELLVDLVFNDNVVNNKECEKERGIPIMTSPPSIIEICILQVSFDPGGAFLTNVEVEVHEARPDFVPRNCYARGWNPFSQKLNPDYLVCSKSPDRCKVWISLISKEIDLIQDLMILSRELLKKDYRMSESLLMLARIKMQDTLSWMDSKDDNYFSFGILPM